jgi:hypothetical protein
MESWQWIFVFFAVMMVARVVPRMLKQRKMKMQGSGGITTDQPFFKESRDQPFVKEAQDQSFSKETKPESKDMMVLGQIVRGYKTFGEIRKKTGFDSEDLNSILEDLEKRELMKVEQKKGMIGIKVEMLPTEKGYREYDS